MLAVILILLLIAVAFGVLGVIIKGLLWMFIIGCVLFVGAMLYAGNRFGRGRGRRTSKTGSAT